MLFRSDHGGNKGVALLISVLALVLAFSETLGKGAQTNALALNIEASNLWNFFQAKTIRQTVLRTAAVPVLLLLPIFGDETGSSVIAWIFITAAVTDLLDGWLARRGRMVTSIGKLLDPLADKLLVCAAMVMLIPSGRVPAWMVAIIVGREIGVTALRGVASTEGLVIAASSLGKAKTILLSIGVGALILNYPVFGIDIHLLGMLFLVPGLILTAWSGLDYFFRFVGEIFKK